VLGFSAVFTSYGAAFGAAGTVLLTHQVALTRVLGALTILLGLMFAGLLDASLSVDAASGSVTGRKSVSPVRPCWG
jgi:cytochrome c biogenesis protein CcdA